MSAMPKPYPQEFRDDVVAVARNGQAPLNQVAKDLGISEGCLHGWLNEADVEDGNRPGVSEKQSGEVRELKKRNRLLEQRTRSCAGRLPTCPRPICRENSLLACP